MMNSKVVVIFLLGALITVSCSHSPFADHPGDLITAEFHLLEGFEKHWVSVELNGDVQFEGHLQQPPSAGSLADFHLDIPQGSHQLVIIWVPTDGNKQAHSSAVNLILDQIKFVYLGLSTYGSSIAVTVQEDPFNHI